MLYRVSQNSRPAENWRVTLMCNQNIKMVICYINIMNLQKRNDGWLLFFSVLMYFYIGVIAMTFSIYILICLPNMYEKYIKIDNIKNNLTSLLIYIFTRNCNLELNSIYRSPIYYILNEARYYSSYLCIVFVLYDSVLLCLFRQLNVTFFKCQNKNLSMIDASS